MAFEDFKRGREKTGPIKQVESPARTREFRDARSFAGEDRDIAGINVKEANKTTRDIWQDKTLREQFKRVGFNMYSGQQQEDFAEMFTNMETGKELTETHRAMRDAVRTEFVQRLGLAQACQKLLVPDLFKGLQDANSPLTRLANDLGTDRALALVSPRVLHLIGEPDGTNSLDTLRSALQQVHGIYNSRDYKGIAGNLASVQKRYKMTPDELAHFTQGGRFGEITGRVFGTLQQDLGWFRSKTAALGSLIHGARVGYAGWRDAGGTFPLGGTSVMTQLRDQRTEALLIIQQVLGPDFQIAVDKEITSEKTDKDARKEADQTLAEEEAKERKFANGASEAEILASRETQWKAYTKQDPAMNTEAGYDMWFEDTFRPGIEDAQEAEAGKRRDGGGWIATMVNFLLGVRLDNLEKPKFP